MLITFTAHTPIAMIQYTIHYKLYTGNIAKGTTDPRIEFISQGQTQILIKFHLQNLDQASTSKYQPNISLSITLKLQSLDQT